MNLCVHATVDCSIEEFRVMFNKYEDELRKCASDWKIGIVNDHEIIALWNITDMDGLQTIMSSPEMTQWDADNNAVDVIYSIEKIS